jgi:hypothetical protein
MSDALQDASNHLDEVTITEAINSNRYALQDTSRGVVYIIELNKGRKLYTAYSGPIISLLEPATSDSGEAGYKVREKLDIKFKRFTGRVDYKPTHPLILNDIPQRPGLETVEQTRYAVSLQGLKTELVGLDHKTNRLGFGVLARTVEASLDDTISLN